MPPFFCRLSMGLNEKNAKQFDLFSSQTCMVCARLRSWFRRASRANSNLHNQGTKTA